MKFKIHFGDLSTYHKKVCYYLFTNDFTPEYGDIVYNYHFEKIRFRGTKYENITTESDEYRTETIPRKPYRKGKIYTYKKNKIFKLIATDDISYKLPNIESLELPPHEHKQVMIMRLYEGCKKRLVVTEGKWGEKYVHIAPTIGEQLKTHRLDIMTYSFAIGAIIILFVRPDFFVGFIAFLIIFLIIIGVIGGLKEYLIPIHMNNQNVGSIILNIFLVGFGILFVMSVFHNPEGLVGLAVIIGLFGVIFLISILSSEESTTKKKATIKDAERRGYLVKKLYDNYLLNIAGNPSDSSKSVYDDEGNRFVSPKKFKQNIDNSTLKELEEFNEFMFDSRRTSRPSRGNSWDGYHGKTYW